MEKRYRPLVRLRTGLHATAIGLVRRYYNTVWGTRIGEGARISWTAKIDKTYPDGVVIGKYTACAFRSAILTHDFVNGEHRRTTIGDYCFVGAHAVIMPGVTVGDHCIVGTGAIVMRNVPPNSVVMGNPARVIEKDIRTGPWGRRIPPAAGGRLAAVGDEA